MQRCQSCGRENPDDAKFCGSCGTPLDSEPSRQERKLVTVVFCDLVGFTSRAESLDPEDVRALLTPYHARLRRELERFGGTVEKFIGDAVVAVFGAPTAHEDDPERAVRAALAIRDWARDDTSDIEVRVAVNTGPALVSLDADPGRGEGIVAGDVINTAARLQTAAPVNGVLVGEQTYRATRALIQYADHPPVDAKGKVEHVPVWEALHTLRRLGSAAELAPKTDFVGRTRELHILRDAFERARHEREPQLVTLVAVPGSGKSRLVYELSRELDADPEHISWRQGRCLSYGEGVNFWALAEIVKAETGILDNDPADVATEKIAVAVRRLLPETDAGWIEKWLRPLVGLGRTETLHGARDQTFPAWRRFLEAIAEHEPTVLVVEDLHWADDGLLDFVDDLLEWTSGLPLLVVATARPELLVRRPNWGGGKTNAVTLSLPPLTDDETAVLVQQLLNRSVLDAELQRLLLDRAGGNPLYAEEFARIFAEQGSSECIVPETVQGIIAARLDVLEPSEKSLLQDATIVGSTFWSGALAVLCACERKDLEPRLRELERREFIRRSRRSTMEGEIEYTFRHELVREIAYEQIPRAERGIRHQRAAEWLTGLGRADDHAELLAHHYLEAISYFRAANADIGAIAAPARAALRTAGDRALGLAAYRQAQRFYEEALKLGEFDDDERAHLLYGAGTSQFWWNAGGEEELAAAVPLLRKSGDVETAARAALQLARAVWSHADAAGIEPWLKVVDELISGSPGSIVQVEALVVRAGFHMVGGKYEAAITKIDEALELLGGVDRPDLLARSYDIRGCSRCGLGEEAGLEDQRRGIETARAGRAIWELNHGINNMIVSQMFFGRLEEAHDLIDEWETAYEEIGGTVFSYVWLLAAHSYDRFMRGDWDGALAAVERYFSLVPAGETHYLDAQGYLMRAQVTYARGGDAHADFDHAIQNARRTGDAQITGPISCEYGRYLVGEQRLAEAAEVFEEALSSPQEMGSDAAFDFAWLAVDVGRADAADKILAVAPFERWREPALAILRGDYAQAADLQRQMGHRVAEAYTRLRAGGPHLQAAREFYESVGATRFLSEIERQVAASA